MTVEHSGGEVGEENVVPTLVCGIGASAGGLHPLEDFFSALPPRTGIAFVVVQHLAVDHDSVMDTLLARHTDLPIDVAVDGMALEPDHIYLIAPGTELKVAKHSLEVTRRSIADTDLNRPIDALFLSLAESYGHRSAGIVLSGTGTDGATGLIELALRSALTLVQDDSAEFDGMPTAALAHGRPSAVLAPAAMARALVEFAASGELPSKTAEDVLTASEAAIIYQLERSSGVPLTQHKVAPLRRRLSQRVAAAGVQIEDYEDLIVHDEDERAVLITSLLIDVTEFFRDPLAFAVLEHEVIPQVVVDAASQDRAVRVWVPGCSSGEEAYSIAMLLIEAVESLPGEQPPVQVFATDIRGDVFASGRNELFSEERMAGVSHVRRDRHFLQEEGGWRVGQKLRSVTTFVVHDILDDPPFTSLDIVSCRNLLIYFREQAQERALNTIGFALRSGGVLFQGPSEHIGLLEESFSPVSSSWRIWRKSTRRNHRETLRPVMRLPQPRDVSPAARFSDRRLLSAYDVLLETQQVCGLLVAENRELLHVFGDAQEWIEQPSGRPTLDAIDLIHDRAMRVSILAIIRELANGADQSSTRQVLVTTSAGADQSTPSLLQGRRMVSRRETVFLIYSTPLEDPLRPLPDLSGRSANAESSAAATTPTTTISADEATYVEQLEAEAEYLRESLLTALTEQETSDEELNASNEELLASNEELQSSNEELSSVNEELRTLNEEHRRRLEQVLDLSADLEQLMASTEMAVVFLDEDRRIRRYNESARNYFRIRDTDIGRPLSEISMLLDFDDLEADIARVADFGEHLVFRQVKSHADDSRELIVQMGRYELPRQRTGVSISVIDLTEALVNDEERMFASFLRNAPVRFAVWDETNRFRYLNTSFNELSATQVVGRTPTEVLPVEFGERLEAQIQAVMASGEPASTFETPGDSYDIPSYISTKFRFEVEGEPRVGTMVVDPSKMTELLEVYMHFNLLDLMSGVLAVTTWDRNGNRLNRNVDARTSDNWEMLPGHEDRIRHAISRAVERGESSSVLVEAIPEPGAPSQWREFHVTALDRDPIAAIGVTTDVDRFMQKILEGPNGSDDSASLLLDLTVVNPTPTGDANSLDADPRAVTDD